MKVYAFFKVMRVFGEVGCLLACFLIPHFKFFAAIYLNLYTPCFLSEKCVTKNQE